MSVLQIYIDILSLFTVYYKKVLYRMHFYLGKGPFRRDEMRVVVILYGTKITKIRGEENHE